MSNKNHDELGKFIKVKEHGNAKKSFPVELTGSQKDKILKAIKKLRQIEDSLEAEKKQVNDDIKSKLNKAESLITNLIEVGSSLKTKAYGEVKITVNHYEHGRLMIYHDIETNADLHEFKLNPQADIPLLAPEDEPPDPIYLDFEMKTEL
jgi:hypothetical protein